MTLLESIKSPADLKRIPRDQLPQLAQEMRDRLIDACLASEPGKLYLLLAKATGRIS